MAAFCWPESTFELDAGLGLAVCVKHQGAHVWHLGGCVAFTDQRMPKTLRVRLTRQDRPAPPESVEPARVEIDADALAAGIALALDGLMQRRREERQGRETEASRSTPAGNGRGVRGIGSDD